MSDTLSLFYFGTVCAIMHPDIRSLHKRLIYAAEKYPGGLSMAREKLKRAFFARAKLNISDPQVLQNCLTEGDRVLHELEALAYLHKYRYVSVASCQSTLIV